MGWDIPKKIFHPMGWDDSQSVASHPIPSQPMGHFSEKLHPMGQMGWDGMGWDGMGLSHPTRSSDVDFLFLNVF